MPSLSSFVLFAAAAGVSTVHATFAAGTVNDNDFQLTVGSLLLSCNVAALLIFFFSLVTSVLRLRLDLEVLLRLPHTVRRLRCVILPPHSLLD